MPDIQGDIPNRVRRLPKPTKPTQALQPIFEAVSNSIHAIDDRFKAAATQQGRISVTIRDLRKHNALTATIADNGIGLTSDRYQAFKTADTAYKQDRGGKGVGRLLWLDAFDRIFVASVFLEQGRLMKRSFTFRLTATDQITDEKLVDADAGTETGTTVTLTGLRGEYATRFPTQPASLIRHFGSHFIAEFILGKSPELSIDVDGRAATFPRDISDLLVADRGETLVNTEEYGDLKLASFVLKKAASSEFDGFHQLHYVANGRTVATRKIDGLLGIARFGDDDDLVYHGCVSGDFLDRSVNQERTGFNFDEQVSEDIAKCCADAIRENSLKPEIEQFDSERLQTMQTFLADYPSFQFEPAEALLSKTPKNATKPEQFAQALIPTRIRRDQARRNDIQKIVETLSGTDAVPDNFAEAIKQTADDMRAEEQRQLTEYVIRRKLVLDVLDVLIRRVRQTDGEKDEFHLESTLHQFICPMRVRGDDPSKIEASDHDLWIIDERLTFAKYFASDLPFKGMIENSKNIERSDLIIFDRIYGLGFKSDEPLTKVMLVEFKKPGRKDYDERYTPSMQVSKYLNELKEGRVESYDRERIRISPDCVFSCYVVADIVGNLKVHTSTWAPTANGRGRWLPLGGDFRGSIEIIEWKDLLTDARARNAAFINAAGLSNTPR